MVRIIGLDPGLCHVGWGVIESQGTNLTHVSHGIIHTSLNKSLAERLNEIYQGLERVIVQYNPQESAVEEVFVNVNPLSTLKLGMARGVVMLAPAVTGIEVAEYSANKVKKSVVGSGHASKDQVVQMIQILLPGCGAQKDAADALAVAICHAHFRNYKKL